MHTIEIPDIGVKKVIPSTLEEMTPSQFAFLAGQLYRLNRGEIDMNELKTMLVFKLVEIGFNKGKYMRMSDFDKIRISENVYRIAEKIDFVFIEKMKAGKPILEFNFNFVHNPVPVFPRMIHRGVFWRFYGPEAALQDITFKQYVDAHTYFENFTKTGNIDALNRLAAALYLTNGHKYDLNKLETRARIMGRLPIGYRFAVYLFFVACEQFLKEGEVEFEGQKLSLKFLYEKTAKEKELEAKMKYKMQSGFSGIIYSLARTGIFGGADKVVEQSLYDILFLLYQQRVDYLNQIESYETK